MSDYLRIVCPNCNTTNRVLRERLGTGAMDVNGPLGRIGSHL